jgi:Fic family protein
MERMRGHTVTLRWEGNPGAYGGRRERLSFSYEAFVPDTIADLDPRVSFDVAAAIDNAERAIEHLNTVAGASTLEAVGPLLLRSEAVASSRIEGYQVSQRNLARALVDPRAAKGTARTVAANVVAMEEAIAVAERPDPLRPADLDQIHALVMEGAPPRLQPGAVRTEQNWVGGNVGSPRGAAYVPPPEGDVPRLMADLVRFAERIDLPAIAQAAIAHAQFETIHPYLDGNGRVGRALIHLILRRRGLAPRFVPPVSTVLVARPDAYVAGLVAFREGDVEAWCASFAAACQVAATQSEELAREVAELQDAWLRRAAVRRDSTAARIIRLLPAQPITSAATIRAAAGSSHQKSLDALKHLEASGVVRQISEGGYDRQYAADGLFALIEAFEARVGMPQARGA